MALDYSFTVILLLAGGFAKAAAFACGGAATCQALAGYIPAKNTTFTAVKDLFQVPSLLSLYAANGLPPTTPSSTKLPANATVLVPFPCRCSAGSGASDRLPVYTVAENDTLSLISDVKFGRLLSYEEIATANRIKNPDLIEPGQKLWIPLPCSCDAREGGVPAVHLAHVVAPGSSVEAIAAKYGSTERELLNVNNMTDPKSLLAYQVLDVPLRACGSSIEEGAVDGSLRVVNGSYAFTAGDCVECGCSAPSWRLACKMSSLSSNNSVCGAPTCVVSGRRPPLELGERLSAGCGSTVCDYAGYYNSSGLNITAVAISDQSTCGAHPPKSSVGDLRPHPAILFAALLLFSL